MTAIDLETKATGFMAMIHNSYIDPSIEPDIKRLLVALLKEVSGQNERQP